MLDAYLFDDLQQVRQIAEQWMEEYNVIRPHDLLGGLPPQQYAQQHEKSPLLIGTKNG